MTIRVSAAREIERLALDLRDGTPVQREAAVARLRVIGARAIGRLAQLVSADQPPHARIAALKALEGIDDTRCVAIAAGVVGDSDPTVSSAAIAVLRVWVTRESGTSALETLSAVALDAQRPSSLRLAALDALSELPRSVVQPLLQQLPQAWQLSETPASAVPLDDPAGAREWLAAQSTAPLSALHEFVRSVRERELEESSPSTRQEWRVARGAAHAVLAHRNSRVALYDLREAFDGAEGPLPLDFLTAMALQGDLTCLEPMARAWAAAPAERWWRSRLQEAASDILRREGLSGRHTVVKRVRAKWPGFI